MAINNITLTGRLGSDAEGGYSKNDKPYVRFRLAVDRFGKDADPNWMTVFVHGNQAERIGEWLTKGRLVAVVGRLETYKRTTQGGDEVDGFMIVAQDVQFLDSKNDAKKEPAAVGADEDVPF